MKTKHAAFMLVAVASFGLAITLFAVDQPPAKTHMQTIKIKSHGETVAVLKVSTKAPIRIEGGGELIDAKGAVNFVSVSPAKGGVTVRINGPGELPITLKADEVEIVPERQRAPLFAE